MNKKQKKAAIYFIVCLLAMFVEPIGNNMKFILIYYPFVLANIAFAGYLINKYSNNVTSHS